MKTVLLIGTLDTKGREIAYLRDRVRALGLATLVLDSGILGINPISTTIFDNAAAAVWGMLQHGHPHPPAPSPMPERGEESFSPSPLVGEGGGGWGDGRYVAVTMLGNTTRGVMAAKDVLE